MKLVIMTGSVTSTITNRFTRTASKRNLSSPVGFNTCIHKVNRILGYNVHILGYEIMLSLRDYYHWITEYFSWHDKSNSITYKVTVDDFLLYLACGTSLLSARQ